MLSKNQKAEVLIESSTPEGFGVCHLEGRAVFVAGALERERWEILILKVTNTAVWAKGVRILEPSSARIPDSCGNPCGGCTLRHMTYEAELNIKKAHVDNCLCRIGEQSTVTSRIHASPITDHYRNKAVFAVDTVDGKAAFGFYRPRSHTLVPVEYCFLQSEECLRAAGAVTEFMNDHSIPAYCEETGKGTVRHLFWRESGLGDRVLCIISARGFGNLTQKLVEHLLDRVPELTGIVLNVNKTRGNTILSGAFHTLWGEADVQERLCGNLFQIAPQAFLQVNPKQAETLYVKATEYAAGGELCLDLYCGAGTVTLALADIFKHVIGAEIVPEAVENAISNASRNGVKNASFVCADVSEIAAKLREEELHPDVIVVDPPRKGLAESVVGSIAGMEPERVVYISCNPATLARDLKRFSELGYKTTAAEAFDMFPRTSHVETVVSLTRNI